MRPNRILLLAEIILACLNFGVASETEASDRPNVVVIFADDLGYGDIGCFGSETNLTPRLDQLAVEGTRFTSFYAQPVCGPSRAALLTGRYPIRSGGWSVPGSEVTIAELFQQAGYKTACVGKWDISGRKPTLDQMPHAQGFDYYWGPLGANDGGRVVIFEGDKKLETIDDMGSLSRIYTDKGIDFIRANKESPFFLYLAHTMVHSIVGASDDFRGKSKGGLYGDAVEELDFHTGRLLDVLDELGLTRNTLVVFTSDNGPWNNFQGRLRKAHHGEIAWGSSKPLREGKGSSYEGGFRVPCIIRYPNHVPTGRTSNAIFSTLDFLPTFAKLAGYAVPEDRVLDGFDQTELLFGKSQTGARDVFYYYSGQELHAIRNGNWKLVLPDRKNFRSYVKDRGTKDAEIYDLNTDIGESKNVASQHPKVVQQILEKSRPFIKEITAYSKAQNYKTLDQIH